MPNGDHAFEFVAGDTIYADLRTLDANGKLVAGEGGKPRGSDLDDRQRGGTPRPSSEFTALDPAASEFIALDPAAMVGGFQGPAPAAVTQPAKGIRVSTGHV